MKQNSIRKRLFFWFILVSLIPMLVVSGLSYYLIYNKIQSQNEETLTNINKGIYNMVDTQRKILDEWLTSAAASFQDKLTSLGTTRFDYNDLQEISGYHVPTWYIGKQKITSDFALVDNLSEQERLAASIFQLHNDTFIRVSTNVRQPDGQRITGTLLDINSPAYKRVINGQTYLGRANVEGIMHATIYVPIKDNNAKLIGAFVLGRREQEYEITRAIQNIVVGETGYAFVLDETGTAIIHPNRQGEDLSKIKADVIKEIHQKKNGSITYEFEGRMKIAYYTYYEPWRWYIVTGSFVSELFNTTVKLTTILVQAVLAVFVISSLLAYLLSSSFYKPISELMQVMRKAQSGDLTSRFSYTTQEDEFRILSNAFNTMLSNLSLLISRIHAHSSKLKDASQRLITDINDSKESLNGIDKTVAVLRLELISNQESSDVPTHPNTSTYEEGQQARYRRPSLTCLNDSNNDKSLPSCYSYLNKVNHLEIEVEKLRLLLKNINSSASTLDDVTFSLDRQVNVFKITNEDENS